MANKSFFQAEHISAGYGQKNVLHDVSLSAESGTLTCLLGANGCGKTTLIKSLAGQLQHQGHCMLQGEMQEDLSLRQRAQRISYIPQRSGITISLPVLDVVTMGFNPKLKLLEKPGKRQLAMARAALAETGMAAYEEQDYLTLSEGQKQLVILARLLIEETDLLLLDEPDSAMDFQNRHIMMRRIRDIIKGGGKAGILCLHDPMLALTYCDQIVLLKDGCCIGEIYPQSDAVEVMEPALRQIYGNVRVAEICQSAGKRHLTLIWEETV